MGGTLDIREAHRLQGNEEPESREDRQSGENPDNKQSGGNARSRNNPDSR